MSCGAHRMTCREPRPRGDLRAPRGTRQGLWRNGPGIGGAEQQPEMQAGRLCWHFLSSFSVPGTYSIVSFKLIEKLPLLSPFYR